MNTRLHSVCFHTHLRSDPMFLFSRYSSYDNKVVHFQHVHGVIKVTYLYVMDLDRCSGFRLCFVMSLLLTSGSNDGMMSNDISVQVSKKDYWSVWGQFLFTSEFNENTIINNKLCDIFGGKF